MFKKALFATILLSTISVAGAKTTVVKLTSKPVFSEEGVSFNTNKGRKIFYTIPWIEDKRKEQNMSVLDKAKKGHCLKITELEPNSDSEVIIRKATCRK